MSRPEPSRHGTMERLQRLMSRRSDWHHSASPTVPGDVEKSLTEGASGMQRRQFIEEEDVFPPSPPPDHAMHDPAVRFTAEEQLRAFRHLIGITNDRSLSQRTSGRPELVSTGGAHGIRAAPNLGLYQRVVHNEKVAKDGHKWYSLLISTALGSQIIVAATLTALGAADGSRTAVTIFGAINTIIAGFLTYLKGSGLPSRLKYYQNEWKKLREYIEQRERDFSRAVHGGGPPPPDAELLREVGHIERMYLETKTDIEVNTPDGYTSISKASQNRPNMLSSLLHPRAPQQPQQQQQQQEQQLYQPQPRRQSAAPFVNEPMPPEPARLSSGSLLQRGSGMSDFSGMASKLQGALGQLEKHLPKEHSNGQGGVGGIPEHLAKDLEHLLPSGLTEKLKRLSAKVEGDAHHASEAVAEAGNTAAGMAASGVATAERAVDHAEKAARATKDDVARHTQDVARDLEAHERAVQEARRRVEGLAGRLVKDVHDGVSGA